MFTSMGELAQSHLQNPDGALWGPSEVGAGRSKSRGMRCPEGVPVFFSAIHDHFSLQIFYLLYFYIQIADILVDREVLC